MKDFFLSQSHLPLPLGEGLRVRDLIIMPKDKIEFARFLRKKATPQEFIMWAKLRNSRYKGLKFKRQVPIGKYIVDFLCKEKILIIEIDGWQHKEEFSGEKEIARTVYLESQDYTILRFWNDQVNTNLVGVFTEIDRWVGREDEPSSFSDPHPNPHPNPHP